MALFAIIVILPRAAGAQQIAFSTGDLVFKGDFRYRHEQISEEGSNQRDRERIRARMSVTATVDPKVNFVFGIASGSGNDPISSNQDMGAGFSDKPVWIDMAYFDWTTPVPGVKLRGGKMKNPFLAVGRSQLIWDGDLNPEGMAAQFSRKFNTTEFFANASMFWITERKADKDNFLLGGQAGIRQAASPAELTLGAGLFAYTNAKGSATFYDATKSFGNSVDAQKNYLYDYRVMEVFGELAVTKKIPSSILFDFAKNIASDVGNDQAYLVGISLGKTAQKGSMAGRIFYRSVDRDAVVGAFSDSDFGGGGTDNKGTIFQYDYQYTKNTSLSTTFFMNKTPRKKSIDYNRLQIDMNLKF